MNFGQDDELLADTIIQSFKGMNKLKEQLRYVLLVLYQLDDKGQVKFHTSIMKIEKYLADIKFMRAISERDGMVDEHPIEYFGKDYGYDDPFIYKQALELRINKIELELLAVLGMVIKHLKQHMIISDET